MKMSRPPVRSPRQQGVALVTTVIVVAVLAVVAVAMMQSTSVDRFSSRSVANHYRARLAAESGAAVAQAMVAGLVRRYPDSVTVWQNIGGGAANGTNNEATVLYVRAEAADTNRGALPWQSGSAVSLLARPLVSLSNIATDAQLQLFPLGGVSSALPYAVEDTTMVNLNATNSVRPRPFIGSRSMTNTGSPVAAAQWVYMGASPGPTNATNPAIARYAFWVEDESFKVNVNVVTNGARLATSPGLAPTDLRLDGSWGSSSNSVLRGANFSAVIEARDSLPGSNFPSALTTALAASITDSEATDELKFLTTVHSAGLDVSRGGFKRFNINSVTNRITGPTDTANIRANLDRVIAAITNTNSAPNFGQRFYRLRNDAAGINSTNAVSTNHAAIYLNKIAANLLDYVDDNDQPTVISNGSSFSLVTGRPATGILPLGGGTSGTNPIAAMGVENVPRLQEYAIHLRVRSMKWDVNNNDSFGFVFNTNQGAVNPTTATYEIWLDHYFEFWNPGTRDYTNSPDAFLKIFDQPAWGPGVGGGVVTGPPRGGGSIVTNNRTTSDIPLIDALTGEPVVFPAGEVTVLTTASPFGAINTGANPADFLVVTPNPNALVPLKVPPADRIFKGTTSSIRTQDYDYQPGAAAIGGGPDFGYDRLFEVQMQYGRPGGSIGGDYASGVLIGNDQGIIESHVGLPINASGQPVEKFRFTAIVESSWRRNDLDHVGGNLLNGNADNIRGGGLRGNANLGRSTASSKPNPTEGDPRSLLEQLEINIYSGSTNDTRFFQTLGPGADGGFFGTSTFGRPSANYVIASNWTDYSSINSGASNAPLFVRNGPMQSIGELGHITDPARPYIASGSVPVLARGGGRTLRVGQSELTNRGGTNIAWYDGNQTNASRTWTSWRLADIFTTTAASNSATAPDPLGVLTNSFGVVRGATNSSGAVVTIPGLINPNGFLRDRGAAWRATLHGLNYLPAPEGVGLPALNDFRINGLVNAMAARMTNAAAAGLPAGSLNAFWERGEISELPVFNTGSIPANMSNQFDRGREELVRRSIEMITTRGSVFSVYAIGQSLQGTNVTSTAQIKQTFEIIPQFAAAALNDNFAVPAGIATRFAAPTNYTVRVLATSYD